MKFQIDRVQLPYSFVAFIVFKSLFIFLSPVSVSTEIRKLIAEKLSTKMKMFLWASGYYRENGFADKNVSDLVGISIKKYKAVGQAFVAEYNGISFGFNDWRRDGQKTFCDKNDGFVVEDEGATVLARYLDGRVCAAKKGNTFYCGVGNVPKELFRYIAEEAGVHMYADCGITVSATTHFVGVNSMLERVTLTMPCDGTYEEVFEGKLYPTKNQQLEYIAKPGKTALFLRIK